MPSNSAMLYRSVNISTNNINSSSKSNNSNNSSSNTTGYTRMPKLNLGDAATSSLNVNNNNNNNSSTAPANNTDTNNVCDKSNKSNNNNIKSLGAVSTSSSQTVSRSSTPKPNFLSAAPPPPPPPALALATKRTSLSLVRNKNNNAASSSSRQDKIVADDRSVLPTELKENAAALQQQQQRHRFLAPPQKPMGGPSVSPRGNVYDLHRRSSITEVLAIRGNASTSTNIFPLPKATTTTTTTTTALPPANPTTTGGSNSSRFDNGSVISSSTSSIPIAPANNHSSRASFPLSQHPIKPMAATIGSTSAVSHIATTSGRDEPHPLGVSTVPPKTAVAKPVSPPGHLEGLPKLAMAPQNLISQFPSAVDICRNSSNLTDASSPSFVSTSAYVLGSSAETLTSDPTLPHNSSNSATDDAIKITDRLSPISCMPNGLTPTHASVLSYGAVKQIMKMTGCLDMSGMGADRAEHAESGAVSSSSTPPLMPQPPLTVPAGVPSERPAFTKTEGASTVTEDASATRPSANKAATTWDHAATGRPPLSSISTSAVKTPLDKRQSRQEASPHYADNAVDAYKNTAAAATTTSAVGSSEASPISFVSESCPRLFGGRRSTLVGGCSQPLSAHSQCPLYFHSTSTELPPSASTNSDLDVNGRPGGATASSAAADGDDANDRLTFEGPGSMGGPHELAFATPPQDITSISVEEVRREVSWTLDPARASMVPRTFAALNTSAESTPPITTTTTPTVSAVSASITAPLLPSSNYLVDKAVEGASPKKEDSGPFTRSVTTEDDATTTTPANSPPFPEYACESALITPRLSLEEPSGGAFAIARRALNSNTTLRSSGGAGAVSRTTPSDSIATYNTSGIVTVVAHAPDADVTRERHSLLQKRGGTVNVLSPHPPAHSPSFLAHQETAVFHSHRGSRSSASTATPHRPFSRGSFSTVASNHTHNASIDHIYTAGNSSCTLHRFARTVRPDVNHLNNSSFGGGGGIGSISDVGTAMQRSSILDAILAFHSNSSPESLPTVVPLTAQDNCPPHSPPTSSASEGALVTPDPDTSSADEPKKRYSKPSLDFQNFTNLYAGLGQRITELYEAACWGGAPMANSPSMQHDALESMSIFTGTAMHDKKPLFIQLDDQPSTSALPARLKTEWTAGIPPLSLLSPGCATPTKNSAGAGGRETPGCGPLSAEMIAASANLCGTPQNKRVFRSVLAQPPEPAVRQSSQRSEEYYPLHSIVSRESAGGSPVVNSWGTVSLGSRRAQSSQATGAAGGSGSKQYSASNNSNDASTSDRRTVRLLADPWPDRALDTHHSARSPNSATTSVLSGALDDSQNNSRDGVVSRDRTGILVPPRVPVMPHNEHGHLALQSLLVRPGSSTLPSALPLADFCVSTPLSTGAPSFVSVGTTSSSAAPTRAAVSPCELAPASPGLPAITPAVGGTENSEQGGPQQLTVTPLIIPSVNTSHPIMHFSALPSSSEDAMAFPNFSSNPTLGSGRAACGFRLSPSNNMKRHSSNGLLPPQTGESGVDGGVARFFGLNNVSVTCSSQLGDGSAQDPEMSGENTRHHMWISGLGAVRCESRHALHAEPSSFQASVVSAGAPPECSTALIPSLLYVPKELLQHPEIQHIQVYTDSSSEPEKK